VIDLDLGGPWPQIPNLLFFNPALYFEPQTRGFEGVDWFKFQRTDTTQATTYILTYPSFGDTLTRTFFIDTLGAGFAFPSDVTFYGTQWHYCHNGRFTPLQVFHDSTILALKELPSQAISVLTFFSNPLRYGLSVIHGYVLRGPAVESDQSAEQLGVPGHADDRQPVRHRLVQDPDSGPRRHRRFAADSPGLTAVRRAAGFVGHRRVRPQRRRHAGRAGLVGQRGIVGVSGDASRRRAVLRRGSRLRRGSDPVLDVHQGRIDGLLSDPVASRGRAASQATAAGPRSGAAIQPAAVPLARLPVRA
jgi:hypothetical protein